MPDEMGPTVKEGGKQKHKISEPDVHVDVLTLALG